MQENSPNRSRSNKPNNKPKPKNPNNNNPKPKNPNDGDKPKPKNSNNNNPKSKETFLKHKKHHSKLPKYLSFSDKNAIAEYHLKEPWPKNKTIVVDFYRRAQVPVTFIDSLDEEQLEKHLKLHQNSNALVEIDWTKNTPISIFEICTSNGTLIIHNSNESEILQNFLEKTQIYTKGSDKINRIRKYCHNKKINMIDIDQEYIIPKRYPRGYDYLLQTFLGKPNFNFRAKSIRSTNWSAANLTCYQVLCAAFKSVSEFMLIPIVQSAPKSLGEFFHLPKKFESCHFIPIRFSSNATRSIIFIPNNEEEGSFIPPAIEKLYDGKAFVFGSENGLFGYGTSKGILVTDSEIQPFAHVTIPVSDDCVDDEGIAKIIKKVGWPDHQNFLSLSAKIFFTRKKTEDCPEDPVKGTAKFPSFAKYKPAKFELQPGMPKPQFQSKFNILQIPVNPDYYENFALPVLETIQSLQEAGFQIPQASSFDIDELCESVRIGDFSDQVEENVTQLIESFKKVDQHEIWEILDDIEPTAKEQKAYERILEYDDINELQVKDIKGLLRILDRVCEQRNSFISDLSNLDGKKDKEVNEIMNKLLISVQPSKELVDRVTNYMSGQKSTPIDFDKFLMKTLKHLKAIDEKPMIEQFENFYKNFIEFSANNRDCFEQIRLIVKAIQNIRKFDFQNSSPDENNLFVSNINKMTDAATTYINFMNSHREKPIRVLENLLFKLVFVPSDGKSGLTQIYPVYQMHDQFLFNDDPFANFKSSTGSGKTRCAPFFFSIKALMDKMARPFFIMTQPGSSIIVDKMKDFKTVLGTKNVILVSSVREMLKLYASNTPPSIPVVALFSPQNALFLLSEAESKGIDIISRTRFCLDEIHERSVFTDVFIAKLTSMIKKQKSFPLQVLMMSATPDTRVLRCFGSVKLLELEDSHLFPIDTIQSEVNTKNEVSTEAANQTVSILKEMAYGNKQLGHILIFTSGNSRISEILQRIKNAIKNAKKEIQDKIALESVKVIEYEDEDGSDTNDENKKPHIIRNLKLISDISLDSIDKFNNRINEITKGDDTTLFIIPIIFAGYVPISQKEIAKNIIPQHENVIKIIIATNAIESSITIDHLSAVVDTGLFNQPQFDTQRGLTKLSEEPISFQSQAQRKGRVGRVRPGTSVQISIKGCPFKECLPPDILTTDISSSILSLRKIGIKLEEVKNLPDPIDQVTLNQFMNELYSMEAINKETGELTERGRKISQFESLSPFLAASVMKAACSYDEDNQVLEILGSLIVLIFNSSDLVIDPFAQQLQNYFNEDSDIITILLAFLDLVNIKQWKLKAYRYGMNAKVANGIFSTTSKIAENLNVPTETNHNFHQLQELVKKVDLMDFIQKIIDSIELYKNSWIQCRKASFMTISNLRFVPLLIYIGNSSLAFSEEQVQSEIQLNSRPGSRGLMSPGAAYIFNISHNESMATNFGSCIHRNLKEDPDNGSYAFVKPRSIEEHISLIGQEEFSSVLLSALLKGKEGGFRAFNPLKHTGKDSGNIIFYPSIYKDKCIYTYAPIDKENDDEFRNAVKKVPSLMPFTPSMILVRHPLLHCAIGVNYITPENLNCRIFFFKENEYYPYQINKKTLEFLFNNIDELSKVDNETFIAITGEMLSIPLDSDSQINYDSVRRPTADPKCNFVFGDEPFFYSHLVILSNKKIPGETPIPWTKNEIYADYAPEDYITKIANGIFPDLLTVKEFKKRIFFKNGNSCKITVEGNMPTLGDDGILYEQSTSTRSVDAMFDRYAMFCVNGNTLVQDVDLKSFSLNGPQLPHLEYLSKNESVLIKEISLEEFSQISYYFQQVQKSKQHPKNYFSDLIQKLNELKDERRALIEQQNSSTVPNFKDLSRDEKNRIRENNQRIKNERSSIESQISQIQSEINDLKIPPKPKIDPKYGKIFDIIKSPEQFQFAKKLCDYKIHHFKSGEAALDIPTNLSDSEKENYIQNFIQSAFPSMSSSIKYEEVPLYEITFNHPKNSPLSSEEFTNRINEVCQRFGAIISFVSKYKEINTSKNPTLKGQLFVHMYSPTFTIPFCSMVSDEIFGKDHAFLYIPRQIKINQRTLSNDVKLRNVMEKWLAANDFDIHLSKNKWIGPKTDVDKALQLLVSSPPEFPVKYIQIPGGVDIVNLSNEIRRLSKSGKKKWQIVFSKRSIIVPSSTEESEVTKIIDKYKQLGHQDDDFEDEELTYLGDIAYCGEDALLSTKLVNVYKRDGTVQSKNFCRACIRDGLISALGKMFDDATDTPVMNKVYENIDFIQPLLLLIAPEGKTIPIGQLIWAFIADNDIAAPARTYITAIALQALKKSPFITYCPQHPSILFRKPVNGSLRCIVSGCRMMFCDDCKKWHKPGACPEKTPIPKGFRICPNCRSIVEKSMACNRLTCNCGKTFCYYCGAGPYDTSSECYDHLNKVHKGYFVDPPDYRKFVKNDTSVTDEELEEFYNKYPVFRDLRV